MGRSKHKTNLITHATEDDARAILAREGRRVKPQPEPRHGKDGER